MITCEPNPDNGSMFITGTTPNGTGVVTREVPGEAPFLLRGGALPVTTGGIVLTDTEGPLGVPLTYRATITGISTNDRLIQQNLMPTPTFTHGVQGWLAGTGRTMTTPADATAHSTAAVAKVTGNASGVAPSAPPTLVGHIDSTLPVNASYTLTPPTGGGTAIATNDWMAWVHTQSSAVALPATPSGWTLVDSSTSGPVSTVIWTRKRLVGDTGYTAVALASSNSVASIYWVRSALDEIILTATTPVAAAGSSTTLVSAQASVLRPALVVTMATEYHSGTLAIPTSGSVTGGTWQYSLQPAALGPPSLTVATFSAANGADTPTTTVQYAGPITGGNITQLSFQVANTIADRLIARGKTTLIPGSATPFLLTGRFKFLSTGLWLWSDVVAQGTWLNLRTTKATWLDVRGVASTVPADYTKLFIGIVDPATGNNYVPVKQVIGLGEIQVNTWIDFAAFFTSVTDIPATAEVRIYHGAALKEYAIDWYFDEFGITPGPQLAAHNTLHWFDGDTTVPTNAEDYMLPEGTWDPVTTDASITWAGTVGNSISTFRGPSGVTSTTTCQLDAPAEVPCEPVLLSDPVNASMVIWAGLVGVDDLTHQANRSLYRVLSRSPAVAVSQVRSWEDSSLTVMTETRAERKQFLKVMQSGRIMLLRNPDPDYPENNWYLSVGDITESRPIPNQRVPNRVWTVPFSRVERPTGLIEATAGQTWQDVKDIGSWLTVRTNRTDWLDVLTDEG